MLRTAHRRLFVLAGLTLLLAACTATTGGNDADAQSSTATSVPLSTADVDDGSEDPGKLPTTPELVAELSGTLAVTVENLIVAVSPDGSYVDLVDGGANGTATQPVWSPDGSRLAWVFVGPDGESVRVRSEGGEMLESESAVSLPFYIQWNASGRQLAYLRPSPPAAPPLGDGPTGALQAGVIEPGEPVRPVASGSPFYISWAPDADELIAYRNGNELLVLSGDADSGRVPDGAGPYTAPVWTGPDTVIVSDADSIDELNIETGVRTELVKVPGRVRFVLSPDLQRLAFSAAENGVSAGEEDRLVVRDVQTSEQSVVASGSLLAWEWSPNSESLAWLSPEVDESASELPGFVWSFWKDGEVEAGEAYLPSATDVREYLPFFEQFAQSHHRWSPDSTAFAFAGSIEGRGGIWVQIVGQADEPSYLTQGDAVTWGPGEPPAVGSSI